MIRSYAENLANTYYAVCASAKCWGVLVASSAVVLCSACAVTYVDREGSTHVLGIANVVIPADRAASIGARVVRAQTLGLNVAKTAEGVIEFGVGYNSEAFVVVNNNSCVLVPNLSVLFQSHNTSGNSL